MQATRFADGHVAVLTLFPPLPPADSLRESLQDVRDGTTRVVLAVAPQGGNEGELWADADLLWLERFQLPIVFAFSGALSGAWLEVAAACDVRLCDAGASVSASGIRGMVAARRLRTLVGEGIALRLLQDGETFDAELALSTGLVSAVHPAARLEEEARRLAEVIASRGPVAMQLAKEAIWRGLAMPLEQALRFETDLTLLLQTTNDRAEGVAAFLEKRPPQFKGT